MRFTMKLIGIIIGMVMVASANSAPWEPIGPQGASVFALARSPYDPRIVLAGTNFGGIYRSTDSGISWQHVPTEFSNKVVFVISFDPGNPSTLYAGTFETGAFKSTDSGLTWTAINQGLDDLNITAISVSPSNSNHVIIGSGIGAYRSTDGGQSWTFSSAGLPGGQVRAAIWDPLAGDVAYVGTTTDGVFRSDDGGVSWTHFDDGMGARNVTDLALDTDGPTRLYACTSNGVFTREVGDVAWTDISYQIAEAACSQILPLKGSTAVLAATNQAIYRLNDLTQTNWDTVSLVDTRSVLANDELTLFHVAASASSLIVTEDFISFFPSDGGMQNRFAGTLATVAIGPETLIYAGTDVGVEFTSEFFIQPDGSLPWVPGFQFDGAIFGITPHPSRSETIYIGTERGGVWQTNDYGFGWAPSSNGMVPEQVFDLTPVPTEPGKMYAATSSGLFISYDDGVSWAPDSNTAISFPIATVASDPERPGVAFYGTFSGDVLRTLDGTRFLPTWKHPDGAAIKDIVASRWHNIYLITETGDLFASDDVGEVFIRRAEDDISEKVQAVAVDPEQPWVVYVGTVFGGVYKSVSNAIEWTQINNGINVPIVTALAIDAIDPDIVYAGGLGEVYRTVDGGTNWVSKTDGLPDAVVLDIEIDETNSSVLYATLHDNGLYSSVDSGETWAQLQWGTAFLQETSIALSSTTPGRLFAGTQLFGIQVSNDGGMTFASSSDGMTPFVRTVAMSQFAEVMYAGSLSAGVFKSTNEAVSWQPTGLSDRNVFHVVIDPIDSSRVFAGTSLGVSRSVDGAQSWQNLGDRTAFAFDILSDPDTPGTLYVAGLSGRIFTSSDGGGIWSQLNSSLPEGNVVSIALDTNSDLLYAAIQDLGVFRYQLPVGPWEQLPIMGSAGTRPLDIAVDSGSGVLLVATNSGGIYRSMNQGDSWQSASTGLTSDVVVEITFDPLNEGVVYAATLANTGSGAGLHSSTDGGSSWAPITIPVSSVISVSVSPHESSRLYVVADDSQVWISNNAGDSWIEVDGGLAGVPVRTVDEDPIVAGRLFAATSASAGIYISDDAGVNWSAPINPAVGDNVAFAFGTASGSIYVANLGSGVLLSTDGGMTFDAGFDSGLKSVPVLFLAIDPTNSQRLFAATGGIGVLRSEDGGLTWAPVLTDVPLFLSVVIDPDNPQRIYAGAAEFGVYLSEDGGDTWVAFNDGLFSKTVTALTIDPVDSSVIYAGTEGGGVFRRATNAP